jgi:hypothetical protein
MQDLQAPDVDKQQITAEVQQRSVFQLVVRTSNNGQRSGEKT